MATLPSRFARARIGGLRLVCLPAFLEPLAETYRWHRWCFDAVRSQPGSSFVSGRKPLVVGEIGGEPVLVKRLHHGGALARLTGDRFLTARRWRTSLKALVELQRRQIPTTELVFAAWRRAVASVRGELGFRWIEGAADAATAVFGREQPEPAAEDAARRVGRLVRRLHDEGVLHHDLNLRNVLLGDDGTARIIDVDKISFRNGPLGATRRRRNLSRLERSVRKIARLRGVPVQRADAAWVWIGEGYGGAGA